MGSPPARAVGVTDPLRARRWIIQRLVGSASASKTPGRSSMIRSATIRAYQQCCQALVALVPASVVLVERGDALRLGKGRESGLHHAHACAALNRFEIEFDQGQRLLLCQW